MSFLTVARAAELEQLIKNSRFIAWVARAKSVEEATAFLEEAKTRYPRRLAPHLDLPHRRRG